MVRDFLDFLLMKICIFVCWYDNFFQTKRVALIHLIESKINEKNIFNLFSWNGKHFDWKTFIYRSSTKMYHLSLSSGLFFDLDCKSKDKWNLYCLRKFALTFRKKIIQWESRWLIYTCKWLLSTNRHYQWQ